MKRNPLLSRQVKKRDNNSCAKCGVYRESHSDTIAHHIIPLGFNGPDTTENMATLCTHCDKFVPECYLEREWYQPVFDDYVATDARPEVDLGRFGAGIEIKPEALTDIYSTVAENLRSFDDGHEHKEPEYFWLTLAALSDYGCVSEAIGNKFGVFEMVDWGTQNDEIIEELYS